MAVPYTFGSATTSIPLSQLDSNFATTITLGNTAIQLGNTVTTLNNMTLANVSVTQATFTSNVVVSVTDNTNAALRITQLGTGNALLVEDSSNPDSTPFVIDASGNVGIGTTTATQKLDLSSNGTLIIQSTRYSTDTSEPAITLRKARGTVASPSIVSSGDTVTSLNFQGYDGADFLNVARIISQVDGTPGTGDMPGRLVFSTTADGASSSTERMRIDSSGRVLVGLTSPNTSGANFQVSQGVTFPATQSASSDANTLDDYEEGSWTPAVAFGGGTTGITYSTQTGQYVKIGRFVYATFNILLTSKGSSSGSVTVTGLPFSISSTVTYGICIANTFNLNSTIQTVLQMGSGGTTMDIKGGGTDSNIGSTDFTNSTQVRATVAYTSA